MLDLLFFMCFLIFAWISILDFVESTTINITNNQRKLNQKIEKPDTFIILEDAGINNTDGYNIRIIALASLALFAIITIVLILL